MIEPKENLPFSNPLSSLGFDKIIKELRLSEDDAYEVVKSAMRKLASLYHPDAHKDKPEAAYRIVSSILDKLKDKETFRNWYLEVKLKKKGRAKADKLSTEINKLKNRIIVLESELKKERARFSAMAYDSWGVYLGKHKEIANPDALWISELPVSAKLSILKTITTSIYGKAKLSFVDTPILFEVVEPRWIYCKETKERYLLIGSFRAYDLTNIEEIVQNIIPMIVPEKHHFLLVRPEKARQPYALGVVDEILIPKELNEKLKLFERAQEKRKTLKASSARKYRRFRLKMV